MYRGCIISVPVLSYKDWRVQYNFGDEQEEKRFCDKIRKEYPYKEDVEKVK